MSNTLKNSAAFEHFVPCTKAIISEYLIARPGETKLGEVISVPEDDDLRLFLQSTTAIFVVVGIAEDIGVLANNGRPGTSTAWQSFFTAFVNIQFNRFTSTPVAIAGHFNFDKLKKDAESKTSDSNITIDLYRKAVEKIDEEVAGIIHLIVSAGKIPIVIGGGHNNAYPIIKGAAQASGQTAINAVNLDAHIDYRQREGRHSGNRFRYAKEEGYLKKYFVVGLHENYLPESILSELSENEEVKFVTFEEIFVRHGMTWDQALEKASIFVGGSSLTGIELDLDCLENLESSAATPVGLTSREALQFVHRMGTKTTAAYVHICEGISSPQSRLTGKLISYVVCEFIRAVSAKRSADVLQTRP